jgi:nanoRNase/pAp phosphatase (c-di-AMP/oligoRNAs hydrolase)
MLSYGGGGHEAAGTCQVPHHMTDEVIEEITAVVNQAERVTAEHP